MVDVDEIKEILARHLDGAAMDPSRAAEVAAALRKAVGRRAPSGFKMIEFEGGGFWLFKNDLPEYLHPEMNAEDATVAHFQDVLRLFPPTEDALRSAGIDIPPTMKHHSRTQMREPETGRFRESRWKKRTPAQPKFGGTFFR